MDDPLTFLQAGRFTLAGNSHARGSAMRVELMYFEDCPNWKRVDERLLTLATERGLHVKRRLVRTQEEAEALGFRGSPTILVDGRDPFANGDEPFGLACRVYDTPDGSAGSPTFEQLQSALDG
jgi:hypothetical protein